VALMRSGATIGTFSSSEASSSRIRLPERTPLATAGLTLLTAFAP
jgi:hypothetical protein